MEKIINLPGAKNKVLRDMQKCIKQIRRLSIIDPENIKDGIDILRKIRAEAYEDINQIQHEEMILRAVEYLQENEFYGAEIVWYWNARQTGGANEPDLRGQNSNHIIISAEITTSEKPTGTLAQRMQTTLKKLNEMDGRRYYFVRTSTMENRAMKKIERNNYTIEVKRI